MNKNKLPFKERLFRFMSGRYGPDELYRFLLLIAVILMVINIFVPNVKVSGFLGGLTLLCLIYGMFRCFSRNLYARRRENDEYLKIRNSVTGWFRLCRDRWRDRKTYVYRRCPGCRKVLRLPRRPGHHTVCCPLCSHRFEVRVAGKKGK